MSANSRIEWTHHTFNPWWGCTKVSEACKNCYAERDAKRHHALPIWGQDVGRRFFGDRHWAEPLKWNRIAAVKGVRERVFCASMADVFEDRDDLVAQRTRLFKLIRMTPWLDWLLLTKRPENILKQAPMDWHVWGAPRNVWLGFSCETQQRLEERWEHMESAGRVLRPTAIFLSAEPLFGDLDLGQCLETVNIGDEEHDVWTAKLGWVIVGGESGPGARPMYPDHVRSIRDQCVAASVPFHFKQWEEWAPLGAPRSHFICEHGHFDVLSDDRIAKHRDGDQCSGSTEGVNRIGKKLAGRLLDGREWNEFPELVVEEVG